MLQTIRLTFAATSLALVALPAGIVPHAPALAQGAGGPAGGEAEAPKQVTLTQKQIDGLLAAQSEMTAAQPKAPANEAAQPDPKLEGKMEAIAKRNGFASLADYEQAADSVGIVLAGMDPETKTYVGPAAIIRKQMAQVQADKTLPAKDKAATLKEMKEALASAGSIQPLPGNAEIVAKNYEKLSEAFQGGE